MDEWRGPCSFPFHAVPRSAGPHWHLASGSLRQHLSASSPPSLPLVSGGTVRGGSPSTACQGLSRQVGTPASLSIGVLGLRCREPLQKVPGPRVFRPSSISDSEDCPLHTHRVSPVSRQAPGGHRTPTLRDRSFCPPCLAAGCHSPGT